MKIKLKIKIFFFSFKMFTQSPGTPPLRSRSRSPSPQRRALSPSPNYKLIPKSPEYESFVMEYPHRYGLDISTPSFRTVHTPGGVSLSLGKNTGKVSEIIQILEENYPQYGKPVSMLIDHVQVYPNNIPGYEDRLAYFSRRAVHNPYNPNPRSLLVMFERPIAQTLDLSKSVALMFPSKAGMLRLEVVPLEFNVGQIKELLARKYDVAPAKLLLAGQDVPNEANLALDFELQTYSHPNIIFASKEETHQVKHMLTKSRYEKTTKKIMDASARLVQKEEIRRLKRSNHLAHHILKNLLEVSAMSKELRMLHELSHTESPFYEEHHRVLENLYEMISSQNKTA